LIAVELFEDPGFPAGVYIEKASRTVQAMIEVA